MTQTRIQIGATLAGPAFAYVFFYIPLAYLSSKYHPIPIITAIAVAFTLTAVLFATGLIRKLRFNPTVILLGICTAAIIKTTLEAYAIKGSAITILAVLVAMRAGVFIEAPIIDILGRYLHRRTQSRIGIVCGIYCPACKRVSLGSWIALGLSVIAVCSLLFHQAINWYKSSYIYKGPVTESNRIVDLLLIYFLAYAVKLLIMTPIKHGAPITERQIILASDQVYGVAIYLMIAIGEYVLQSNHAIIPLGPLGTWAILPAIAIGICSQLTGVFGGLVLLNPAAHAITVPINRAGGLIAGFIAAVFLREIHRGEIVGLVLLVVAIGILQVKKLQRAL